MAFRRQMDHPVDSVVEEHLPHLLVVADVRLHESVVRQILHVPQVREVARIGQLVEVHDPVRRVFLRKQPHDVRADEAGTAGNQYVTIHKLNNGFDRRYDPDIYPSF